MAAGKKTGGRKKGARNKATLKRKAEIATSGLSPLDYMLGILRDEEQEQSARFAAAQQAAPYCHPKLASTELKGPGNAPLFPVLNVTIGKD